MGQGVAELWDIDWVQEKWFHRNGGTAEKGRDQLPGRKGTWGPRKRSLEAGRQGARERESQG